MLPPDAMLADVLCGAIDYAITLPLISPLCRYALYAAMLFR